MSFHICLYDLLRRGRSRRRALANLGEGAEATTRAFGALAALYAGSLGGYNARGAIRNGGISRGAGWRGGIKLEDRGLIWVRMRLDRYYIPVRAEVLAQNGIIRFTTFAMLRARQKDIRVQ